MKTLASLLLATCALLTCTTSGFALPSWKEGPPTPAMTKHDFKALKDGDRLLLICKASDTIQIIDVKDRNAAMELCKEGRMLNCPVCHKEYKIVQGNPTGKGTGSQTTVVAVDEQGHPCMFFAKLEK